MTEEVKISTIGMDCTKPLIEMKKALIRMEAGQVLVVEGDQKESRNEIPQAARDSGNEVLSEEDLESTWIIKIRKQ